MSIYLNRAFRQSNSSLLLSAGKAIQSNVVRLRGDTFLVDSGLGPARTCPQEELLAVPASTVTNRFEVKVGSAGLTSAADSSPPIRRMILERYFVDIVAGDSIMKDRALAKFNSTVGSSDPLLVLPRRFRQNRAWLELNYLFRKSKQVKGFLFEKFQSGRQPRRSYKVAIAGYLAYLQSMPIRNPNVKISTARFTISSLKSKRKNMVVFMNAGGMYGRGVWGRRMGKVISVSSSPQEVEVQELCLTAEKASKEESVPDGNEKGIYKTQVAGNRYDFLCLAGISQFLRIFMGFDPIPVLAVANMGSMFKMHVKPEVL